MTAFDLRLVFPTLGRPSIPPLLELPNKSTEGNTSYRISVGGRGRGLQVAQGEKALIVVRDESRWFPGYQIIP